MSQAQAVTTQYYLSSMAVPTTSIQVAPLLSILCQKNCPNHLLRFWLETEGRVTHSSPVEIHHAFDPGRVDVIFITTSLTVWKLRSYNFSWYDMGGFAVGTTVTVYNQVLQSRWDHTDSLVIHDSSQEECRSIVCFE